MDTCTKRFPFYASVVLIALCGCDGVIGEANREGEINTPDPAVPRFLHEEELPRTEDIAPYARLTRTEYRYVLVDLLAGAPVALRRAAFEAVEGLPQNTYEGYYNHYADINVGSQLAAHQWAIATATAAAFVQSNWYMRLCPSEAVCVTNVVAELLPRVWKRRLDVEEEADLVAFFGSLPAEGRMARFFSRVFLSPYFHFKIFPEAPATRDAENIKRAQLLSFALCGSFPDEELQQDVDSGEIDQPGRWQHHVNRLLNRGGLRFSVLFITQWLGLAPLYEADGTYRDVSERAVMSEPARIFHEAMEEGRTIASFIRLPFNVVDGRTASLYDSTHIGPEWIREPHTATLFGTAALSRVYVDLESGNPSPIRRGSFVANRLLCHNLLFPDSSVQEEVDTVVDSAPEGLSPPERLAYFRSHDTCASCHAQFDPFGLALEDIGPEGEMRTNYYTGDLIEVAGEFEGQPYASSVEFAALLAESESLHHCFASQVHSYVTGAHHLRVLPSIARVPSLYDMPIGGLVSAIVTNALGVE